MIHADDRHLVDRLLDLGKNWWIAGGTPLRWYENRPADSDIDLFFRDHSDLENMRARLDGLHEEYASWFSPAPKHRLMVSRKHETKNAISYDLQVPTATNDGYDIFQLQLIKRRYYQDALAVLADFDISVCQIAIDRDGRVFVGEHFARDVAERRLRFVNITPTSAKRLIKYWVYGFQPDDDTVRAIMDAPDLNLARSDDDY